MAIKEKEELLSEDIWQINGDCGITGRPGEDCGGVMEPMRLFGVSNNDCRQ